MTTVGILGAGPAGLYTAMILDDLNIHYDILEASNRVGGRLFTYKFPGGGENDYFDVGAMRFPRTNAHRRVFDLFTKLNLAEGVDLLPYYFHGRQDEGDERPLLYYNRKRTRQPGPQTQQQREQDFFEVKNVLHTRDGLRKEDYIKVGTDAIVNDVIHPFASQLLKDLADPTRRRRIGWEMSVRHGWVEGALDSAWRAVAEMLTHADFEIQRNNFRARWGTNPEWVNGENENIFAVDSLFRNHLAAMQAYNNVA